MIQSTRPKVNRVKYAATMLGALAVAVTPLAYPAVATAQRVWDIEAYDNCTFGLENFRWEYWDQMKKCCLDSGGVWKQDEYKCVAPPSEAPAGSRGTHLRPGIADAPAVTMVPEEQLRPIRVPSDIATVSTVSQGNELAS